MAGDGDSIVFWNVDRVPGREDLVGVLEAEDDACGAFPAESGEGEGDGSSEGSEGSEVVCGGLRLLVVLALLLMLVRVLVLVVGHVLGQVGLLMELVHRRQRVAGHIRLVRYNGRGFRKAATR